MLHDEQIALHKLSALKWATVLVCATAFSPEKRTRGLTTVKVIILFLRSTRLYLFVLYFWPPSWTSPQQAPCGQLRK